MTTKLNTNGQARKSLSDQIDRLDMMLDGLRACESNLGLRIIREKATSPFRREQERATFFFDGIHNPTTASASHRRPPATHPDHVPGKPP